MADVLMGIITFALLIAVIVCLSLMVLEIQKLEKFVKKKDGKQTVTDQCGDYGNE